MVYEYYIKEIGYRLGYLIYGSLLGGIIVYLYGKEYLELMILPYKEGLGEHRFVCLNILEMFNVYLSLGQVIFLTIFLLGLMIQVGEYLINMVKGSDVIWLSKVLVGVMLGFIGIYHKVVFHGIIYWGYSFISGEISMELRVWEYKNLYIKYMMVWLLLSILFISIGYYIIKKETTCGVTKKIRRYINFLFFIIIIVLVPADIMIHGIVLLLLGGLLEILIIIKYLIEGYKKKIYKKNRIKRGL